MKLYPESASAQLEFDKIKSLLHEKCRFEYAMSKANELRIHTLKEFIDRELKQSHEFKQLLQNGIYFPNDYILNLSKELRLLNIEGAVLSGEQLVAFRKLALSMESIFRWFDAERRVSYPGLAEVIAGTFYEKAILKLINDVIDDSGNVKDNASEDLLSIRMGLYRKRNELRKAFDRIVGRLNKQGHLADIEESFMNGRRVLAVFAEQKRMVKGILHGESDSRRTSFIEPEETTELDNEIFSLEIEEGREVYKILQALTLKLSIYAPLLKTYHDVLGEFDFIKAKAKLAIDIDGNYPTIHDKAFLNLKNAYHPLLYLYNKPSGKLTVPVNLTLDDRHRILVISGPNAGGKTVTLKTIGLLQMMVQSGLLVSCSPDSGFGIFKQLMI